MSKTNTKPFTNLIADHLIRKGFTPDMFDGGETPDGFSDALYDSLNRLFHLENVVVECILKKGGDA